MKEYLEEPTKTRIDAMYVLSCLIVSDNPEEEVISLMHDYLKQHAITGQRFFGFDYPIEKKDPNIRGYEYWVQIEEDTFNQIKDQTYNGHPIKKKLIPASSYFMLGIDHPFDDPFTRIKEGWDYLVKRFESEGLRYNDKDHLNCLEEIIGDRMYIYLPFKK